ncbi:MAG TPA: hypothetical protein VLY04_25560 [Bryobacteraceae bacterium]|nr:hypothetical protein [Bryobacteraceae bacterium]
MKHHVAPPALPPARSRHGNEAGFAMLLVFLLASCVAIMLYLEIPRVAFEAERQRELLLIDRGNQFKRGIQVFVTDKANNPTGRYPASIDELESFNGHRYLRRKYVDPMTGKDEWRLVHIQGGVLTDSVTTQQKKQTDASTGTGSNYINELTTAGVGPDQPQGGANAAMRRRPSDSAPQPGGTVPDSSGAVADAPTSGQPGGSIPGVPGGQPGSPVPPVPIPGIPGMPGAPGTGPSSGGQAQNCNAYIGGCAPAAPNPPVGIPGLPGGVPGMPGSGQGSSGAGLPGLPGSSGGAAGGATGSSFGQQGLPTNQPGGQPVAVNMINNLLTSPRPGGMPTSTPGSAIGGGIAGFASKYEAEGIMVINDRTAINEWEYIFDFTKWRPPLNPLSGTPGQQAGTPIGNQTTNPAGVGPMNPGASPINPKQ